MAKDMTREPLAINHTAESPVLTVVRIQGDEIIMLSWHGIPVAMEILVSGATQCPWESWFHLHDDGISAYK